MLKPVVVGLSLLVGLGTLVSANPAQAYWWHGRWIAYGPPPRPVYVVPARPVYAVPVAPPPRFWVPPHYNRFGAWVPGHWRY